MSKLIKIVTYTLFIWIPVFLFLPGILVSILNLILGSTWSAIISTIVSIGLLLGIPFSWFFWREEREIGR